MESEARPPLPSTLSPSKVSSFTTCALAFRFSAIDRLPEPPSLAASRGTFVHAALQALYRRPAAERTVDAALADLADVWAELAPTPEFAELGLDKAGTDQLLSDAAALTRRYFEIEDPTTIEPIGLELMLTAEIGGLTLRGIIDRLDRLDDGSLVVVDYKSGSSPRQGFERGRLAGVQFYALLCQEVLGVMPVQVRLVYLADAQVISVEPSERTTRAVAGKTAAVWKAIERAYERDDFRPNKSKLCDWCSFQQYCPEYGGDPAEARAVALTLR